MQPVCISVTVIRPTSSPTEWSTAVIRDHDVATPALLCHKEPAQITKLGRNGGYFLPFAGSLWHKGADNRSFPCMEATYHDLK